MHALPIILPIDISETLETCVRRTGDTIIVSRLPPLPMLLLSVIVEASLLLGTAMELNVVEASSPARRAVVDAEPLLMASVLASMIWWRNWCRSWTAHSRHIVDVEPLLMASGCNGVDKIDVEPLSMALV